MEGVFLHVCPPARADQLIGEGVLQGRHHPRLDQGLRHVRADDVPPLGDLRHPLERDRVPELLKFLDHSLPAAEPVVPQPLELFHEIGIARVHEVAQDVHALPVVHRGELHAGDDLDPVLFAGGGRLGQPIRRVVIGQGHRVQAAFPG